MAKNETNEKVCVVTGALGSIGLAICKGLAAQGCRVVMVARDAQRGAAGRDEVAQATGNEKIEVQACDLGSLASVREAAAELCRRFPRIDVLVNCAAAFSGTRKTTRDGFELQLGVNHLAHHLLTRLLEAPLMASGHSRVVVMGMPAKNPILFDDLMLERKYDGMTAYGMSKAANLHFARALAERWSGRVTVNAVHPGMVRTTLIQEAPLPIRLVFAIAAASPEKGADTPVWLALDPALEGRTGGFYIKRKATAFPAPTDDEQARARLWAESERLVGLA